jgi:uridine kinase
MTPVVVGIGGGSASGKSTVVQRLVGRLGVDTAVVVAHDYYYRDRVDLSPADRAAVNYDHPDAFDTGLLVSHLVALRSGRSIDAPVYDFTSHTRQPQVTRLDPRPAIIVEGILVLAEPALRRLLDVKVFVDTDERTRRLRRFARDVRERGRTAQSVAAQYASTVEPMHRAFVEPSRRHADLVVAEGGENATAIETLFVRVSALMQDRASGHPR